MRYNNPNAAFENHIKSHDKLILLLGTGVSIAISNNSVSTWNGWLQNGLTYADKQEQDEITTLLEKGTADALIAAAEALKTHLIGKGQYIAWMENTIGSLCPQYPALGHTIGKLMDLNTAVLTTNYDTLIEQLTGTESITYKDTKQVLKLFQGQKKDAIFHIHGCYTKVPPYDDTIAGIKDYNSILQNETYQFFQKLFATQSVVCIGCGATFNDPNIGPLLNWISTVDDSIQHFALVLEGNVPHLPSNVLPVFYGKSHHDLPEFLHQIYIKRRNSRLLNFGYMKHDKTRVNLIDLSYLSECIPYCGRNAEIDTILNFCAQEHWFLWSILSGPAGSGKSRLMLECNNRLSVYWHTFFLEKQLDFQMEGYCPATDTLISIDYISGREKAIAQFIKHIYSCFENSGYKLRIVLIERSNNLNTGSWYRKLELAENTYKWGEIFKYRYCPKGKVSLIHLYDIDDNTARDIIENVFLLIQYQFDKRDVEELLNLFKQIFKTRYRRPLFLQLLAIGWAEEHVTWQNTTDLSQILSWILDREEMRWKQILERYFTSEGDLNRIYDYWKEIICYCAVSGGIKISELQDLPDDLQMIIKELFLLVGGSRQDRIYEQSICQFLDEMLGYEGEHISEISIEWPDIIIESMFLRFINRDKDSLKIFTNTCIDINRDSAIRFLNKINEDFPYDKLASELLLLNPRLIKLPDQASDIRFPKPLSHEMEQYYFEKLAAGNMEARTILIEHHLRLVSHIIKKFYGNISDQDDLFSIGTIGLIKAVSTFEYGKHVRFATYAARCIENEVLMFIRSNKKYSPDISLSDPISIDMDGNPVTLADVVSRENDDLLDSYFLDTQRKIVMEIVTKKLPSQEREILGLRYGLSGNDPFTHREIAQKLGVSRSYVIRLERKALKTLREELQHDSGY